MSKSRKTFHKSKRTNNNSLLTNIGLRVVLLIAVLNQTLKGVLAQVEPDSSIPPLADNLKQKNDFFHSSCLSEGILKDCVQEICTDVAKLSSLNLPTGASFLFVGNQLRFGLDPLAPEAQSEIDGYGNPKFIDEIFSSLRQNTREDGVKIKSKLKGVPKDVIETLVNADQIEKRSMRPDCTGKSAQVALRLFAQPLLQDKNATIIVEPRIIKDKAFPMSHVTTRITTPHGDNLICDAWVPQAVVCDDNMTPPSSTCKTYKKKYWNPEPSILLKTQPTGLKSSPLATQRLFERESQNIIRKAEVNAITMESTRDKLKKKIQKFKAMRSSGHHGDL